MLITLLACVSILYLLMPLVQKNMKKYIKDYCVGCGLCEALGKAKCCEDERGFLHPESGDEEWLSSVCPSGGRQQAAMDFGKIWGKTQAVYYGWSKDEAVRRGASSGGIITEIASWLLEHHSVDGVIHTCPDPDDETKTVSCISTTRDELIGRSGSRYSISHPLSVMGMLDKTKRYAFIGKPCDIAALNNYILIQPEVQNVIVVTLSFFCAGLPSRDAQDKLLSHLGCQKDKLKSLRYRGDGWPGYTTAVAMDGGVYRTDYPTSWGKILGRDIMKMCRFCLDGIGEAADISCGDAWYLTEDKKPDFSEGEGRNVVFARTEKGAELLQKVIQDCKIEVQPANMADIGCMQAYQRDRRASMIDKLIAAKVLGKSVPRWKWTSIINYGSHISFRRHLSILKGTLKRIVNGKI